MPLAEEFLKEHYAAARHQQTMRFQGLTILSAASGILLAQGMSTQQPELVLTCGLTLFALGVIAILLNQHFQFANRYHVDVARHTRDRLSDDIVKNEPDKKNDLLKRSELENPNLIGEAVRLSRERKCEYKEALQLVRQGERAKLRIGNLLNRVLFCVPILMILGGLGLSYRAAVLAHLCF